MRWVHHMIYRKTLTSSSLIIMLTTCNYKNSIDLGFGS
jgi:hypothetical protein